MLIASAKIRRAFKAATLRDLGNAVFGALQHDVRDLQAIVTEIIHGGFSDHVLEYVAEIMLTDTAMLGETVDRDMLGIVVTDIAQGGLNEAVGTQTVVFGVC